MSRLAKEFLLGAATAAHQVEGNNRFSDFWALEMAPHSIFKEPSGVAADHLNRYKVDIDLLASAGLNAYRFTIEWARIQPEKESIDAQAIHHYKQVLEYCISKDVTPVVTMHHFSSPRWLIYEGGWESPEVAGFFADYCALVVKELGHLMGYVCTINEVNIGLQIQKMISRAMRQRTGLQVGLADTMSESLQLQQQGMLDAFPGVKPEAVYHFLSGRSDQGNAAIMLAHEEARNAMKAIRPELMVGLTLSLHDIQPQDGGEAQARQEWHDEFLRYLPHIEQDDFLGVQNYTRSMIGPSGLLPAPAGSVLTQMGYEEYPQALGHVVRAVAQAWKKPILITENGLATDDDDRRVAFIHQALAGVQSCIEDGIDVRGYLHWSLLDNFEWMLGFEKTFGLVAVDRDTLVRRPKNSLRILGSYRDRLFLKSPNC